MKKLKLIKVLKYQCFNLREKEVQSPSLMENPRLTIVNIKFQWLKVTHVCRCLASLESSIQICMDRHPSETLWIQDSKGNKHRPSFIRRRLINQFSSSITLQFINRATPSNLTISSKCKNLKISSHECCLSLRGQRAASSYLKKTKTWKIWGPRHPQPYLTSWTAVIALRKKLQSFIQWGRAITCSREKMMSWVDLRYRRRQFRRHTFLSPYLWPRLLNWARPLFTLSLLILMLILNE